MSDWVFLLRNRPAHFINITPDAVIYLQENKTVVSLNLNGNGITHQGAKYVSLLLRENSHIRSLVSSGRVHASIRGATVHQIIDDLYLSSTIH